MDFRPSVGNQTEAISRSELRYFHEEDTAGAREVFQMIQDSFAFGRQADIVDYTLPQITGMLLVPSNSGSETISDPMSISSAVSSMPKQLPPSRGRESPGAMKQQPQTWAESSLSDCSNRYPINSGCKFRRRAMKLKIKRFNLASGTILGDITLSTISQNNPNRPEWKGGKQCERGSPDECRIACGRTKDRNRI